MSIVAAISHIHDEITKVEDWFHHTSSGSSTASADSNIYEWALKGIEAEISSLHVRIQDLLAAKQAAPVASSAGNAPASAQNGAVGEASPGPISGTSS